MVVLDTDQINHTKKACVAIGIVEKNKHLPKTIFGSGFFINSDRHILTAKHVLEKCTNWYRTFNRNEIKYEVVAFHVEQTEHDINLQVIPISEFFPLELSLTNYPTAYAGPNDLDIGIGIPGAKVPISYAPYLDFDDEMKNPRTLKPMEARIWGLSMGYQLNYFRRYR